MAAGQERYYLELGREDYYLEGGEPLGRWFGRGAATLGLTGNVQKEDLRALVSGLDPRDGQPLGQQQKYTDGRARQVGWDLTFSVPKSVSVLWSQAPEGRRATIEDAHFAAVKAALSYLEETAAVARRGRGGTLLEPAELVAATFEHGTSRAQDPQLHTHCLVMASARRADGSWSQLHSRPLYEHKMAAGALYRLALANSLRELGVELRPEGTWFEAKHVPEQLSEAFSKRRTEIEELLSTLGVSGARASERLAVTSRQVKEHVARGPLFSRWQAEAGELHFGEAEASSLFAKQPLPTRTLSEDTLREALKELTDTETTFTERSLLLRVAEKVQAEGVSPGEVLSKVRAFLARSEQVAQLAVGEETSPVYTDASLYKAEEDLFLIAEKLHSRNSHGVPKKVAEKLSYCLNGEQRAALEHMTGAGGLKLVSGLAGTGKTYTLDAARMAWERAGYTVRGATLWGRAAAELEQTAGIKSSTIESLLYRLEPSLKRTLLHHARMLLREAAGRPTWKLASFPLNKHTVLVIDEAGVVGSRHLSRILFRAERAGAKVVLVGDPHQLQSIDSGGGFHALIDRFGGARLTQIVRQEAAWMRKAVHDFVQGDAKSALARYVLADRLHIEQTREAAMHALVFAWKKECTEKLSETLILAGTNKETDELNRRAQAARSGELGAAFHHKKGTFFEGDRVLFTAKQYRLGVLNGDFGTVEAVNGNRIGVLLDRQKITEDGLRDIRVVLREKDLTVRAFGRKRDLLRLGYATTVHRAQGSTVDRSFVLAGGWMQDKEMAYVQMSRAREHTRIFCDQPTAGEDLSELARAMSRSREKRLAHDMEAHLTLGPS